MTKTICILSGGLDSTTLLYDLISQGHQVEALSFSYNQRHKRELEMAKKTCEKLSIPHEIINIDPKLLQGSALTSDIDVPKGHYKDESMKLTVVSNRNMIFIASAIGYAIVKDFDAIALGIHSGDHAIYPDCRPEFIYSMILPAQLANYKSIEIMKPYLYYDKGDIVKRGKELEVDYSLTWTCYEGSENPCGKCGACMERAEAFKKANMKDPLIKVVYKKEVEL